MLKLKTPTKPTIRPYWHVDAKWICGIIFALLLSAATTLHILATLTSRPIAIPVATQIAAGLVSRNGLDDTTDIDQLKKKSLLQPGDQVETLPGIFVTKAELNTLSPRELRLKIFTQVVTPYYDLGAKGVAASQTKDPLKQANIEQQAGLLGLLNQSTHDHLQQLSEVSLILLIAPLVGLIYFSAGFGRLVSPGLILTFATLPAAIAGLVLTIAQHSSKPVGGSPSGPIPGLSPESLVIIMRAVLPAFQITFTVGATLLAAAAIGKALSRHRQPKPQQA